MQHELAAAGCEKLMFCKIHGEQLFVCWENGDCICQRCLKETLINAWKSNTSHIQILPHNPVRFSCGDHLQENEVKIEN